MKNIKFFAQNFRSISSEGAEIELSPVTTFTGVKGTKDYKNFKSIKYKERVPEHQRNLIYLIKNNSEIRRFTAIGIINHILQSGEMYGEKRYVKFLWDKFCVIIDGINREYRYTEKFFLTALINSFSMFSASASKTIVTYVEQENISYDNEFNPATEKVTEESVEVETEVE